MCVFAATYVLVYLCVLVHFNPSECKIKFLYTNRETDLQRGERNIIREGRDQERGHATCD
ncbi:hypothetical protein AAZV13_07G138233 [Glycine max]